jgi:hypothetical protein
VHHPGFGHSCSADTICQPATCEFSGGMSTSVQCHINQVSGRKCKRPHLVVEEGTKDWITFVEESAIIVEESSRMVHNCR